MNRAFRASFLKAPPASGILLALSAALALPANAGDASFGPKANAAAREAKCSGQGPDYFAIKGSTACIKITGYIAADANFGAARFRQRPFAPDSQLGTAPLVGGSADVRFPTPYGPGLVHLSLGREPGAR